MTSEELERSLRSEFEGQVKTILAEVQQQVADFQQKIDAELDKHRDQMGEAFKDFSSRLTAERPLEKAFTETVVEYLRLARDDGARITAAAMEQAETMNAGAAETANFTSTRDAVNDISSQTSQSSILHSLVRHAGQFTPRGIFFIVRNEHFIGWQAFGREAATNESAVGELNFSVEADTVLSDAVRSLVSVERGGDAVSGDGAFLDPLGFGRPAKMYAIPLIARGRGVAALYVDGGASDQNVNIEALEMLLRVASLTVELLASNQSTRPQAAETEQTAATAEAAGEAETTVSDGEKAPYVEEPAAATEKQEESGSPTSTEEPADAYQVDAAEIQAEDIEVLEESVEPAPANQAVRDFDFRPNDFSTRDIAGTQDTVEPAQGNGNGTAVPERRAEQASRLPAPTRKLDLPIEVSEAERGTHTKARRFARLLVSEIKLYNEEKVKKGREAGDLYDRLREAIDRSREMYDRRVEAPVSSKFDYFHYELVNDLAEGDEARLGGSYPGAAV